MERTWDRLKTKIPASQAAYQGGRSTTEQVFALKLICEKAITSEKYEIFILMLDMSKAFDTVDRPKLLKHLEKILNAGEMRLMEILINDVILNVRIGKNTGKEINTEIGIAQGDFLSAVLFIFYLSIALEKEEEEAEEKVKEDHNYGMYWSDLDWIINKDLHNVKIDPKYADDITYVRSAYHKINRKKRTIPSTLEKENLYINNEKTEEFTASRENSSWKKCKLLGSILDTENDLNRRMILAIETSKQLNYIFKSRKISTQVKVRILQTYIRSTYLYNSELWTLTKKLENTIDTFHRKQLRKILGIKWPKTISNKRLYKKTKQKPWSTEVRRRRLTWFGHMMRLSNNTPAKLALKKYLEPKKKPSGKPKRTWIKQILEDIKNNSNIITHQKDERLEINELKEICGDRKRWRRVVRDMMLQ